MQMILYGGAIGGYAAFLFSAERLFPLRRSTRRPWGIFSFWDRRTAPWGSMCPNRLFGSASQGTRNPETTGCWRR